MAGINHPGAFSAKVHHRAMFLGVLSIYAE
jgi:hypothetical protein